MTFDDKATLAAPVAAQIPDEHAYVALWSKRVSGLDSLTAQAVQGGLLADRMAWVFVAGYQCALRHTFSELPADGIAVFAVSEDRKNDPPLPGVKTLWQDGSVTVSGYKTWVACSASLSHLVIKADRGEAAKYYCIERAAAGLNLMDKHGGFLAEMSQGVAHLDKVAVSAPLDASEVAHFGLRETLYIYMAFCAWAGKCVADVARCEDLIQRLAALVVNIPADVEGLAELKDVDHAVQALRAEVPDTAASAWAKDQRLISMYSPGLQKRQIT